MSSNFFMLLLNYSDDDLYIQHNDSYYGRHNTYKEKKTEENMSWKNSYKSHVL